MDTRYLFEIRLMFSVVLMVCSVAMPLAPFMWLILNSVPAIQALKFVLPLMVPSCMSFLIGILLLRSSPKYRIWKSAQFAKTIRLRSNPLAGTLTLEDGTQVDGLWNYVGQSVESIPGLDQNWHNWKSVGSLKIVNPQYTEPVDHYRPLEVVAYEANDANGHKIQFATQEVSMGIELFFVKSTPSATR